MQVVLCKTFLKIRDMSKETEILDFIVPLLVTWGHNLASSESTKLMGNKSPQHLCPSLLSKTSQVSEALQDMSPTTLLARTLQLFSLCEFLNMKPVCMLLQHISWKAAIPKGQAQL